MNYFEALPNNQLRNFVKCFWQLEVSPEVPAIERVVPDGRMEMLFHFGDVFENVTSDVFTQKRSLLAGQILKPILLRPTGKIGIFGVRFRPQGFSAIFSESSSSVTGSILDLQSVIGNSFRMIEDQILNSQSFEERIGFIESFLISKAGNSKTIDRIPRAVAHHLFENPQESLITELASEFGVGLRQLERKFKEQVGMSPSTFIKIAKFQKSIRARLINPNLSLTTLALECGYYDQSQFSKEFKELSGLSPRQYFGDSHQMADAFSL